jgi:hypothetical protein
MDDVCPSLAVVDNQARVAKQAIADMIDINILNATTVPLKIKKTL